MEFLNSIKRFAGDHLSAGYNAFDNQLGGLLPGGVKVDLGQLGKDMGFDAMPGANAHGATASSRSAATAEDFATGRPDLAATRTRAGIAGGKIREHAVEEGIERAGREVIERIATRGGAYAIPVAGQVLATTDMVRDGMDAIDTVIQINTGESVGEHTDKTIAMRDKNRSIGSLFPEAGYVGEGIHQIGQGTKQNPIVQEIQNRATRAATRFRPLHGDVGFSEVMGWN